MELLTEGEKNEGTS